MPQKLLIYTENITERVKYTFDLVFKDLYGLAYELIEDEILFKESNNIYKVSYTKEPIGNELFFKTNDLLTSNLLCKIEVSVIKHKSINCLFPLEKDNTNESILPFDPFAAIFYMVSRYEEYTTTERDPINRFCAKSCVAYKYDFLHKPVVNIWASWIIDLIENKYPDLKISKPTYSFTPTYDIDTAFSYSGKPYFRQIGSIAKDVIKLDVNKLKERWRVYKHQVNDPYDVFDYLEKTHNENSLKAIYFFLLGDYNKYDKNNRVNYRPFICLIQRLNVRNTIGIHGSYGSNKDLNQLTKEIKRLKQILNTSDITLNRQHYLLLDLPTTYNRLIQAGITDDYTMAYHNIPGFRAGICTPFYFFDLKTNKKTNLKIHPLIVMDVALRNYMKVNADEAITIIGGLINEVKAVEGHFISLFHNQSLTEDEHWFGWRKVYEEHIKLATALD